MANLFPGPLIGLGNIPVCCIIFDAVGSFIGFHSIPLISGQKFHVVVVKLSLRIFYHFKVRVSYASSACFDWIDHWYSPRQFCAGVLSVPIHAQWWQPIPQIHHQALHHSFSILPAVHRNVGLRTFVAKPAPHIFELPCLYHLIIRGWPVVDVNLLFEVAVPLQKVLLLSQFQHSQGTLGVFGAIFIGDVIAHYIDHIFRLCGASRILAAVLPFHYH